MDSMKQFLRIKLPLLLMCSLMALQAVAQVKISGKVIDEKGEPIDFASVRIEGTAIGAVTDTKGMYELTVPPADTIMVIFTCLDELEKPEYQRIFKYLSGAMIDLIWEKGTFKKSAAYFSY